MSQERLFMAVGLVLLSVTALSVWYCMPIYPDEISFRIQLGRYIQDRGVVHGLYPLCASNIKETPLFFVIPAWILSWLDLSLSPVEMRIFPFATVLTAVSLVVWRTAMYGVNPNAAVVATTAFIGVAGSGLILARYEYVQVFNIVCCLLVFHFLNSFSPRPGLRYGLFVLLLISSLMSLYVHVQGLLFLPLTLYLAYQLACPVLGKTRTILLILLSLGFMAQTTIKFHHSSCVEYPEIEQFWARMVFNPNEFESIKLVGWLVGKFEKFLLSFQYTGSYAVNYLPGVAVGNGWPQSFLSLLNHSIQFILLVNLLLVFSIAIGAFIVTVKRYLTQIKFYREPWMTSRLEYGHSPVLVLFILPIIFLFFYDSAQNFYRSFFLNLLIIIVLSIFLSWVSMSRIRTMANMYFTLCGAVVLVSLAVNVWWFSDKLRTGYEGPSISISRDWDGINSDVKALAHDCGMDLSKGGVIVDDMTYDSLKSYSRLYPATYTSLSVDILKSTMSDVLNKIQPNYAIARCDTLRGTGIKYQKSRNQLCCTNFTDPKAEY
jgi:hypothetical protein